MVRFDSMGIKDKIYRNSPKCPKCKKLMGYKTSHLASNRSFWTCSDCNIEVLTRGYPDDDGDPSKNILVILAELMRKYIRMPGVKYGYRGIREGHFAVKNKQTEIPWRGSRKQIPTVHAFNVQGVN